ncbi:heterokaryon incompatibility protein 6, OR allele [Cladorrhinum samala]|uniref:Heterokaryon incompatibility protein 6, OR allele n=1 Tax=Cladorrhinum samala TaxID=585594 RepID=A0AAV9HL01_9PEZI|nr:heterokaryon incompatibility protein 6, OR allele [Cladorrhinum samala]
METTTAAQQNLEPENFRYAAVPLDESMTEIRLLELLPSSSPTEPLICRIFVTTLDDPCKPFKALSYVWGDGTKARHIVVETQHDACHGDAESSTVDGSETRYSKIPITESLFTALLSLRTSHESSSPGGPFIIWIDQLCIHQEDVAEKSYQVSLMGRIYSSAAEVLVWLGPAENNSDAVMEAWRTIGQASRDVGTEGYFTLERWEHLQRATANTDPDDPFTKEYQSIVRKAAEIFPPLVRDMLTWFERPWFYRAWTVQEFCLCPQTFFVCGSQRIPVEFVHLSKLILLSSTSVQTLAAYTKQEGPLPAGFLDRIMEPPSSPLFYCRLRRLNFQRGVEGAPGDGLLALLKKLYVSRDSTKVTEYRDRIYSLLGLAVDAEDLGIAPDYSDMGDPEALARVLTDTARTMITSPTSGSIETLCFSQFPKLPAITDCLPSWVPDWQSGTKPSFYDIKEANKAHIFAACGGLLDVEPVPSPSGPEILGLKGYLVGAIEAVSDGEPWSVQKSDPVRHLLYLAEVEKLADRAAAKDYSSSVARQLPIHGRHRREESEWRVPIGDLYWTVEKGMHRATGEEAGRGFKQFAEYACFFIQCSREPDDDVREKMMEDWGFYDKAMRGDFNYWQSMQYMNGKRPFLTENGYLGMGPADSREGDVVVVFCGGRIPFVLRPVASEGTPGTVHVDEQRFQFVGEAFCDGIMDGEIVTSTERRNFFLV